MGALVSLFSRAPAHETSSLEGQTFLVTGGASGLGIHVTLHLALRGARVLVCSRAATRALPQLRELEEAHPGIKGRVEFFEADLGTMEGPDACAREVERRTERLDGLVNNAARMASAWEMGPDGVEVSMQTNYFGPLILTNALLPLLEKSSKDSPSVRIVTTGAMSYTVAPTDVSLATPATAFNSPLSANPASLNTFNTKFARYSLSKAYTLLWNAELQRKLSSEGTPISCLVVHPGLVITDGSMALMTGFLFCLFVKPLLPLFCLTPSQGAYALLYALTSPDIDANPKKFKGAYIEPWKLVKPIKREWASEERAKELWTLTTEVVAKGGIAAGQK